MEYVRGLRYLRTLHKKIIWNFSLTFLFHLLSLTSFPRKFPPPSISPTSLFECFSLPCFLYGKVAAGGWKKWSNSVFSKCFEKYVNFIFIESKFKVQKHNWTRTYAQWQSIDTIQFAAMRRKRMASVSYIYFSSNRNWSLFLTNCRQISKSPMHTSVNIDTPTMHSHTSRPPSACLFFSLWNVTKSGWGIVVGPTRP